VPIRAITRLAQVQGLTAQALPTRQLQLLMISERGAFKDQNVRLAVHHAIDKAALSKAFYNGVAKPISYCLRPAFPATRRASPSSSARPRPRSFWRSQDFDRQAGQDRLHDHQRRLCQRFDVARAIVQMLKKVGIDANLEVIELANTSS